MPGESFTTEGDGVVHSYSERGVNSGLLYRITIANDTYTPEGTSINGGPLGIGSERSIFKVLELGSSITLHYSRLGEICWNDFGKQCQLAISWSEEPEQ